MICGLLLLLRLVKRLAVDHQPKVESVTQSRLGGFPTAPCRPRPVRRVKVDVQSKSIGGGGGGGGLGCISTALLGFSGSV